jgi:hypothetical protein
MNVYLRVIARFLHDEGAPRQIKAKHPDLHIRVFLLEEEKKTWSRQSPVPELFVI